MTSNDLSSWTNIIESAWTGGKNKEAESILFSIKIHKQ